MKKVVFYQQFPLPYFGILSLVGYLKHHGYEPEIIISSLEKDPIDRLVELSPEIIGISAMTVEHRWLMQAAADIRRALPNSTIIAGGIHTVLYPEEVLSIPEIDLACTGDGEEVLYDILREMEKKEPDWHSLRGIGFRSAEGAVCVNERAPLYSYRDEIIEDRSIYFNRYPLLARDTAHRFISSRGCPYHCNFCYNETLRNLFRNSGPYIRRKSIDNLIAEIRAVCGNNRTDAVFFVDDLFTMDKKWLGQFLLRYRKEINIPFVCTTRANIMDDEKAALLAEAGCRTVSFGLESGSYAIRKIVLNKDITDDLIIQCGRSIKKFGMHVQTANMFCLPEETLQDAFRTIELNIQTGTDFAFASLLMPFPKTAIADYCIEHGFLKSDYSFNDLPESFMNISLLDLKEKDVIINVQRLAYFFIRYPSLYKRFKGAVHHMKLRWFFDLLFAAGNFLRHREERGVSWLSALQYAWRMRKTF
ncbi:MAG: B12-binding domain-containing radical SAM protein [Nitrospirae bacterium]|nr:MAG: B12-binding domain-containing radical SAM protein [Nitrospirota bacterium]